MNKWLFLPSLLYLPFFACNTAAQKRLSAAPPSTDLFSNSTIGSTSARTRTVPDAWHFRYRPDRVKLPHHVMANVQDGHGLAVDSMTGDFYFTFNPKQVTNDTQVLVRFAADGKGEPILLGKPGGLLSMGVPHGLRLEHDCNNKETFLYHANNAQRVTKTTLDGTVVWSTDFSNWKVTRPEFWPICPTDAIAVPGTDMLLVADGYGSNWIHTLNKTTGEFLEGRSFGGDKGGGGSDSRVIRSMSASPLKFDCPHSISLDYHSTSLHDDDTSPRLFIISDRSNHRLVWTTANGTFVKQVYTNSTEPLPCNIDTSISSDPIYGRVAAIPSLGHDFGNLQGGKVGIWAVPVVDSDVTNHQPWFRLSTIEVAQLLGDRGHQHPHDAIFLQNGDLVVCCWSGPANAGQGPALGTISYWERVPMKVPYVNSGSKEATRLGHSEKTGFGRR